MKDEGLSKMPQAGETATHSKSGTHVHRGLFHKLRVQSLQCVSLIDPGQVVHVKISALEPNLEWPHVQ